MSIKTSFWKDSSGKEYQKELINTKRKEGIFVEL